MKNKAEKRRISKEETTAATEKAARKVAKIFLEDSDEDWELEKIGIVDEFFPEVDIFPTTDRDTAVLSKKILMMINRMRFQTLLLLV